MDCAHALHTLCALVPTLEAHLDSKLCQFLSKFGLPVEHPLVRDSSCTCITLAGVCFLIMLSTALPCLNSIALSLTAPCIAKLEPAMGPRKRAASTSGLVLSGTVAEFQANKNTSKLPAVQRASTHCPLCWVT